jgi:hypothetical protein
LGEFSPIEQWFIVGRFFANYRSSPDVGLFFAVVKVMCKFGQKMEWAVIGAIFSQTHLVTLPDCLVCWIVVITFPAMSSHT